MDFITNATYKIHTLACKKLVFNMFTEPQLFIIRYHFWRYFLKLRLLVNYHFCYDFLSILN
jgi:hypothetical protein